MRWVVRLEATMTTTTVFTWPQTIELARAVLAAARGVGQQKGGAMTEAESGEPDPPQTLTEAGEVLWRMRPDGQAPTTEWVTYYQRSAVIYDGIAETDQHHHHEALYMARKARQRAREIETRIRETRQHH
jgi:hypothetical protein